MPSKGWPPGLEELVEVLERGYLPEVEGDEWFEWQALPLDSFYKGMGMIRGQLGPGAFRFLDVGSGIGTKVFLAQAMGFEAHGIELRPEYFEIAQRLFPQCKFKLIDAFDYARYDTFDIIYSYRCAKTDELQNKLNEYIVKQMKDGAIFFSTDTEDAVQTMGQIDGVKVL